MVFGSLFSLQFVKSTATWIPRSYPVRHLHVRTCLHVTDTGAFGTSTVAHAFFCFVFSCDLLCVNANAGIPRLFPDERNQVMSSHLMSVYGRTHREWSLIILKTSGVRARYASPSFWNGQLKVSCILGWSEKIVFQVWIQCFWVWVVEEHFIFKFAHGFYDPLYIILF